MSSFWDRRYTQAHHDHERDHRKHEPRPSDPLPARFTTPMATALEVAVLVKGLKNIRDAEKLVEQYAQTVAAAARLEAVELTANRMMAVIDGHGGSHA